MDSTFLLPMYLSFGSNTLNRVSIKGLHPNIKWNRASPAEQCGNTLYAMAVIQAISCQSI